MSAWFDNFFDDKVIGEYMKGKWFKVGLEKEFAKNFLISLYTRQPDSYWDFSDTYMGLKVKDSKQREFFERLTAGTSFMRLRERTKGNMKLSLLVWKVSLDAHWKTFQGEAPKKKNAIYIDSGTCDAEQDIHGKDLERALEEMSEKSNDLMDVLQTIMVLGIAGTIPVEFNEDLPNKQIIDLAEQINGGMLKNLLKILGSAQQFVRKKKERTRMRRAMVKHRMALGGPIADIIPAEHMLKGVSRLLWLSQAAEGNLICDISKKVPLKRGPVHVIFDESGSMTTPVNIRGNGQDCITRTELAKGIALAIAIQLKKERREMIYTPFGGNLEMKATVKDIPQIIASNHNYGSTDIPRTMRTFFGKQFMQEHGATINHADILLVSDGESPNIGEKDLEIIQKAKNDGDIRILCLQIGQITASDRLKQELEKFCDKVVIVETAQRVPQAIEEIVEWVR